MTLFNLERILHESDRITLLVDYYTDSTDYVWYSKIIIIKETTTYDRNTQPRIDARVAYEHTDRYENIEVKSWYVGLICKTFYDYFEAPEDADKVIESWTNQSLVEAIQTSLIEHFPKYEKWLENAYV